MNTDFNHVLGKFTVREMAILFKAARIGIHDKWTAEKVSESMQVSKEELGMLSQKTNSFGEYIEEPEGVEMDSFLQIGVAEDLPSPSVAGDGSLDDATPEDYSEGPSGLDMLDLEEEDHAEGLAMEIFS